MDNGSRGDLIYYYTVPYTAVRHEYPSFKKTCFAKFRHLKKRVVTLNNVYALKKRVGFPRHESLQLCVNMFLVFFNSHTTQTPTHQYQTLESSLFLLLCS